MTIFIKVIDSEDYEVEKNLSYETIISEIESSKNKNILFRFKDKNNRNVTLNVEHITAIIEENKRKSQIGPIIGGITRKKWSTPQPLDPEGLPRR